MSWSEFIRVLREEHDATPDTAEALADVVAAEGLFDETFDPRRFDEATRALLRRFGVAR